MISILLKQQPPMRMMLYGLLLLQFKGNLASHKYSGTGAKPPDLAGNHLRLSQSPSINTILVHYQPHLFNSHLAWSQE